MMMMMMWGNLGFKMVKNKCIAHAAQSIFCPFGKKFHRE
jgi:hypothetical protein